MEEIKISLLDNATPLGGYYFAFSKRERKGNNLPERTNPADSRIFSSSSSSSTTSFWALGCFRLS